jgi:hypothetical protein
VKLEPGHFYTSRNGETWCCYKTNEGRQAHSEAYCVRVSDGRVEYFFADGRYDEKGEREHTLVSEVPGAIQAEREACAQIAEEYGSPGAAHAIRQRNEPPPTQEMIDAYAKAYAATQERP